MSVNSNKVFISCGQRTEEEKELGNEIQKLVGEITSFEPYFAEYQTSLDGLTKNIFSELYNCVGFITVMHRRGPFGSGQDERASVWIEQEIAVAAFVSETLGKHINVVALAQKGIALEGVRQQLLLNPKEFSSNEEALAHLRVVLPRWTDHAQQSNSLDLSLKYKESNITSERHDYKFLVIVTNRGNEKVEEYHVDLEFPRGVLSAHKYVHVVNDRCSNSHLFFRAPTKEQMDTIYPDDSKQLLDIDYFVDDNIYHNKDILSLPIRATLYEEGKKPKKTERLFSEFQAF